MREYVLIGGERIYKIGNNQKGALTLVCTQGEHLFPPKNLISRECALLSADIDGSERLHIAILSENALTYIRVIDGKSTATHLMHLPPGFDITSLIITAGNDIKVNYTVKSRDGCALIEYTLASDTWQGKNILTVENGLRLLTVSGNHCYIEEKTNDGYIIKDTAEGDITRLNYPAHYAQGLPGGVVFASGGSIYYNECEICPGESVFAQEDNRILINGELLWEMVFNGEFRKIGSVQRPNNSREYALCKSGCGKRIILSPPFPYIKTEMKQNGMLSQEVYMQQRALFSLQGEVRALKSRVRRLEEMMKK